jgi:hypothetical protein
MPKSELHRRKMAEKQDKRRPKDEPTPVIDSSSDEDDEAPGPQSRPRKKEKGGIKWKYVGFLALMFGTACLPAILWIVDNVGGLMGSGVSKSIGAATARMGFTPTPKDRLALFYAKHDEEKVEKVDHLVQKYAGDYSKMIKVLEAKYGDYGFFLGWEQDRTMTKFMKTQASEGLDKVQYYYKRHMPYKARVAFYKMYSLLDKVFRPYIDFIRTQLLNFFPDLKDYIGVPPYYRKPRSSSRSSSKPKTKRKRPSL